MMTEKQRNLIFYLDSLCKEKGLTIRASDDDLLGKDWFEFYGTYTPDYASEVINKLKKALDMPISNNKKRGTKK